MARFYDSAQGGKLSAVEATTDLQAPNRLLHPPLWTSSRCAWDAR